MSFVYYLADFAELTDNKQNNALEDVEGYPTVDLNQPDVAWGLLNWFQLDFIHHRVITQHFKDEAIRSLQLLAHQQDGMIKKGFKLKALNLAMSFPSSVKTADNMEVNNPPPTKA